MLRFHPLLSAFLLLLALAEAGADELPEGGRPLLPESPGWMGEGIPSPAADSAVSEVHRVISVFRPESYRHHHAAPLEGPIHRGDALLLRFRARCVETNHPSGEGQVHAYLRRHGHPFNTSLRQHWPVGPEWTTFQLGALADDDYTTGEMIVQLGRFEEDSIVEVGDVQVFNYGRTVTLAQLPILRPDYEGRAADAPWRAAAAERIQKLRTAPLALRLVDSTGKPVSDARIRATLVKHAFPFGSALTARHLTRTDPEARTYRAKVKTLFNAGSLENSLKWAPWTGEEGTALVGREMALEALQWCADNGLEMRGHVMIWPSRSSVAAALHPLLDARDVPAIKAACLAHIDDLAQGTRGLVSEWDVVNEPYAHHDLMDLCGPEVMIDWFRRARQNLPGIPLALNDYGILSSPRDDPHQAHYEATLRFLLAGGAPVDVAGMQAHFGAQPTAPARVLAILDRYAALGLKIRITEFDIESDDERLQADYLRDFLTAVFSHEAVIGFQMWGFWAGAHWRPKAALYDLEWNERPLGAAYRQLVLETWRTDATLTTDADGRAEIRGFLGDYRITVEGHTTTASLPPGGESVSIQLPSTCPRLRARD